MEELKQKNVKNITRNNMKFKLSLSELVKVWHTTEIEIEANTLQEAIEKVLDGEGEYIDSDTSEVIEYVDPNEEGGKATVIVYNKNKEVYNNSTITYV